MMYYENMIDGFYHFEGENAGPTSVILGGVHGDEKCGVEAIDALVSTLKVKSGDVWVGYANLRAIEENERYTEANLNRMFAPPDSLSQQDLTSYEFQRATEIKPILNGADALLDVHASFTPGARPFAICESNAERLVSFLPVDLVVSGFDDVEPGGTDYYMNKLGKIGICVECGYLGDPNTTDIATKSIDAFLKTMGHIDADVPMQKIEQSYIRMYKLYKTIVNFSLEHAFDDFEEVRKNQVLGVDGDTEVLADRDGIIVFARDMDAANEEAFLLGEFTDSLR